MSRAPAPNNNAGCLIPFGGLFALFGIFFLISGLTKPAADPSQARTQVLVALTVVVIGASLIFAGKSAGKAAQKAQILAARDPAKPWLWREDWAQGFAEPEWRSTAATFGAMGLLFLLVSIPGVAAIPKNWHGHNRYVTLVVLLFPLAGLYLVSQSLFAFFRDRKFRQARLTLSSLPGVIGGRLQGRVESGFLFPSGAQVDLTLSCIRSYVSNSGSSRSRWENVLWQDKHAVTAYAGGAGSYLPVEFTIPYDARETDGRNANDEIFWRLTAVAALPGLDFRASFKAPVFKTEASDAALTGEKMAATEESALAGHRPPGTKITEGTAADGTVRFHFGRARNKGIATALTLFGMLFIGSGAFFGSVMGATFGRLVGGIPLLLAGGMGLLLLLFAAGLWFGETDIGVVGRSLRIRYSCLGLSRSRTANAAEISKLELYPAMQGAGNVWYDLRVHLSNGGMVTAGTGMVKAEPEWFVSELKKDLGI